MAAPRRSDRPRTAKKAVRHSRRSRNIETAPAQSQQIAANSDVPPRTRIFFSKLSKAMRLSPRSAGVNGQCGSAVSQMYRIAAARPFHTARSKTVPRRGNGTIAGQPPKPADAVIRRFPSSSGRTTSPRGESGPPEVTGRRPGQKTKKNRTPRRGSKNQPDLVELSHDGVPSSEPGCPRCNVALKGERPRGGRRPRTAKSPLMYTACSPKNPQKKKTLIVVSVGT